MLRVLYDLEYTILVGRSSSDEAGRRWQFVTNHTQVLLCIARDPQIRLRDVADAVGITVGSAQRILADLVDAGYIKRERHGRRNHYVINRDTPMLRHAAQEGHHIGALLDLLRLEDHG
jgi:DNA-binding MarR family transcriptional regulator